MAQSDHLAPAIAALADRVRELNQSQLAAYRSGADVDALVYQRSDKIDAMLRDLWSAAVSNTDVALVAVGGYGRRELQPQSDIDLMVLVDTPPDDDLSAQIAGFFQGVWDGGLEPGSSVRTLEECDALVRTEITVATNLMESRLLAGSHPLFERLMGMLSPERVWSGSSFFSAKYDEQTQRHDRYGDTAYNLEPNIKEGPGGLRDIQMIAWVARRHFAVGTLDALAGAGFLTPSECNMLMEARSFLWRVRFALHQLCGRREDRLLFEHQRALAVEFGFVDGDNLAVEQFMQSVFRTLIQVERLNERLLQLFEQEILGRGDEGDSFSLDRHFRCRGGFLEVVDEDLFEREPVALMELFVHLACRPEVKGVRAATIRLIRHSLHLIDDQLRNDPTANALFLRLLREGEAIGRELNRMHRYGVLGRFIPEFEAVVGRMQFDMFHVYTVDQHSLTVVEYLHQYTDEEKVADIPFARQVFKRLEKPELLYLAGFFHDIAKGRGGDHSELGAKDAKAFCKRLGLDRADANLVTWLVKHHLDLSVCAQRKDIQDPEVINRFARKVGNWSRLDYLYLLTIADIRGTSPKLWNRWKARLISELYERTRSALRRGLENPLIRDEQARAVKKRSADLLRGERVEAPQFEPIWERFPADYFLRVDPELIAWQTRLLAHSPDMHVVSARSNDRLGASELFVHVVDGVGLFAAIVSALDQLSYNVVEARIASTADGYTLDTIWFLDREGHAVRESGRLQELSRLVNQKLTTPAELQDIPRRISRQLKNFANPVQLDFARKARGNRTLLELIASDRPGLLSCIARAFIACNVNVHDAKIATFGNRVEDFFLLSNDQGRPLSEAQRQRLADALRTNVDQSED